MSGETGCRDENGEELQAIYLFESSSKCIPPIAKLQGSEFHVDGVLMHVFMDVCAHTGNTSLHTCIRVCMYAYMHVFMYVCMYVCMHACMHMYVM